MIAAGEVVGGSLDRRQTPNLGKVRAARTSGEDPCQALIHNFPRSAGGQGARIWAPIPPNPPRSRGGGAPRKPGGRPASRGLTAPLRSTWESVTVET